MTDETTGDAAPADNQADATTPTRKASTRAAIAPAADTPVDPASVIEEQPQTGGSFIRQADGSLIRQTEGN
ncbi:MAG: hypothetical protein KGJ57_18185 [Sphingomonadales bacterium]|nr:hypothetical protein [Sphingomonadales bacterium]MDE2171328.1 hypothetical protein [Sphingomonadales bacterium]